MEKIYENVSYEKLLNDYCVYYIQSFGQIEFEKITEKIQSSEKINNFLKETNRLKIKPTSSDFLAVIHSVFYFTFAKPEKISIAGIILLSRWNKFIAIPNNLSDNYNLNKTFFNIINKSDSFKFHLSSGENFFGKFLSETKNKYEVRNNTFNSPNIFSEIVYDAVLAHIIEEDKLTKVGIFNCYIFYSTYVSLYTSFVNIKNTDNVDLYLVDGIDRLFDFLKLEVEDFYDFNAYDSCFERENIGGYVEDISRFYTEIVHQTLLKKSSFNKNIQAEFILSFNSNEPATELDYFDGELKNVNNHYTLIHTNFSIIDAKYDSILPVAKDLKLDKWLNNKYFNLDNIECFFEELIIPPFKKSRCYICGNFELRELLTLKPYSSDGIFPMCESCDNKNKDSFNYL
jgi:hypothetical protein